MRGLLLVSPGATKNLLSRNNGQVVENPVNLLLIFLLDLGVAGVIPKDDPVSVFIENMVAICVSAVLPKTFVPSNRISENTVPHPQLLLKGFRPTPNIGVEFLPHARRTNVPVATLHRPQTVFLANDNRTVVVVLSK